MSSTSVITRLQRNKTCIKIFSQTSFSKQLLDSRNNVHIIAKATDSKRSHQRKNQEKITLVYNFVYGVFQKICFHFAIY